MVKRKMSNETWTVLKIQRNITSGNIRPIVYNLWKGPESWYMYPDLVIPSM